MTENEVDILAIDSKIQSLFQQERDRLPEYRARLAEMQKTLSVLPNTSRTRPELQQMATDLSQTISRIENDQERSFYIAETAEMLQKYEQILKTPLRMTFVGRCKTDDKEKLELVEKYLDVAQKYYPINRKCAEKKFRLACDNCDNRKDFVMEENACICVICGSQQELLQQNTSYKDADRVNISTKYTYDRKVHFRDCINQYQGKQNCTIEQKVYDDLTDILDRHHLLQGDKTTKKDLRFARITKEHISMFLKELGYSKHYENVTLIHYTLTGKKPDDISHLEDVLMSDFDLLVETYDKLFKNKVDRVNFISTQFVLYQLLQRHKHPCKKEDFVILKTAERKNFHNSVCSELFSHLGWNYVNIL